jgi:uncharacterized protein (TIGR03790 family)
VDRRALAIIAILLLPASSLMLAVGPAFAVDDGSDSMASTGLVDVGPVTLISVEYPKNLDPSDYSDILVLINNNSAMSVQVGEYFAETRNVPGTNVAYLDVVAREVITKDQFEDLKDQVKTYMVTNELVSNINYIVTTKGFPLKIYNASLMYEACVDEELALIFGSREYQIGNYYYVANPYAGKRVYFSHGEQGMYLVNRLTGYDWDDVKGIIDRANDTYGNRGQFVLDVDSSKGYSTGGYGVGNTWMRNARDILVDRGEDVLFNENRTYVKGQTDVMGYTSWGSNDASVNGPGAKPGNTWVNGSIAETYVSTGGRTFTPPPSYGQSMIADWIEENVTGIKGYVYEPFLSAIAHPDILFERYTAGFNLAESYRMASAMLGWMGVVVGDPKCSPYRDIPDLYIDDTMLFPSNSTPATDDPITLRVQVKNFGGRVDNANLTLFLNGFPIIVHNMTFDTFSLTTLDIVLTAPEEVDTHELRVILNDGPNPIFETLMDNNEAVTYFTTKERSVITLTASDDDVMTLDTIRFNIQFTNFPRAIDRYYFDFGDGSPLSILQTNETLHYFEQDGVYNVTAWVLDEEDVLSRQVQVQVTVRNRAPVAIIDLDPSEAPTGTYFLLNASASSDMDGQVTTVLWDLGDGNTSNEFQTHHAFLLPGEYIVRLTVWDDDGTMATATRRIAALNRPPVAGFIFEGNEIWKGRSVTFDATDSRDPDGWVIQYEWDFGDGSSGEISHSPLVNHVFEVAGKVTVALSVIDDMGSFGEVSVDFTVLNREPVVSLIAEPTDLLTEEVVFIDGSRSYDDDGLLMEFEFSLVDPDEGYSILQSGRTETVTFKPMDDGIYTIYLAVTDDDGAQVIDSVELRVHNRPPSIALDEETSELEGSVVEAPTTLTLGVLTQDIDGEVDRITWYLGNGNEIIATGPTANLLVVDEGDITIIIIASDDDGAAVEARLNLTVNLPPQATFTVFMEGIPLDTADLYPRQMLTFDASNSSDPGGVVRYQWDFGDGFLQEGPTLLHAYELPGPYTVTLKVTDGHGATSDTSLLVTVDEEPKVDEPIVSTAALAIIVLVVAVVIIVALTMYMRRRSDGEEGLGD